VTLMVDRDAAKRLGIDMNMVTTVLNNAYSQRQVSTIYDPLNQYQVVMEVNPKYALDPITLEQVQVITADGARVPLSTIARYERSLEDDRVTHDGQFASDNVSFDLADGVTLDQATAAIERAVAAVGLPEDVIAKMAGTADAFAATQKSQPWMILGALVAVYLVLGILYESYIHPLTILSTLPSAGVGALLSIYLTGGQFSLISLLGLFSADRRGEEERHPDDRPCPATGAGQWHDAARVDPQRLSAAPAADSDDHPGGDSRRRAVAAQQRRRARRCVARWA
jgi:multidrug efflux pump